MASSITVPLWARLWLLISGLVCTWDAGFILFRPHSLPGGKYHHIWKPYSIYVEVDKRYKDMKDPFVYAQSLMNLVEVLLCFLTLLLHLCKAGRSTLLVAYSVSLMTMWKTVLYMLQYTELCGGGEYHAQNDAFTNFLYLWLPNGIWIGLPALVCACLAPKLLRSGDSAPAQKGKGEVTGNRKDAKEERLKEDLKTSPSGKSKSPKGKAKKNE